MLRHDATASIDDILSGGDENRTIDPSRSVSRSLANVVLRNLHFSFFISVKCILQINSQQDPWFTDKLFKVLDLFTFHEKLAPFREALELQSSIEYEEDEASIPKSLPKKLMNDFM